MKSVAFKPRATTNPDEWIKSGSETAAEAKPSEPTKRFTIDVPVSLHRRVKVQCAERGLNMADEMRRLLEREFPAAPTS